MQESELNPFLRLKQLIREYEELKKAFSAVSNSTTRLGERLQNVVDEILEIVEQQKIIINPSMGKDKYDNF